MRSLTVKIVLVAIGGLVLATPTFAGGREAGNGGKGVVCRNSSGNVTSVRLLDFYEADVRGIKIDLGAPTLSVQDKINLAISRLDKIDSLRAAKYRERAQNFFDPAYSKFLKDTVLESTDDSYEDSFPEGCTVENLVVRKQPQFPEDRLWTISQDLWNLLDNDDKAGLVMHEVIYDDVLTQVYPQDNSINARYYNSYLSANKLGSMNLETYVKFMENLQFGAVTIDGIWADTSSPISAPSFYPSGAVQAFVIASTDAQYNVNGQNLPVQSALNFYENGEIQSLNLCGPTPMNVYGQALTLSGNIIFYQKGLIHEASLSGAQKISWDGVQVQAEGTIGFSPDGKIVLLDLAGENTVPAYGMSLVASSVGLDSNGNIVSLNMDHTQLVSLGGQQVDASGEIDFNTAGKITRLSLFGTNPVQAYGTVLNASSVEFDSSGNITSLRLDQPQPYTWLGQTHTIDNCDQQYPVSFASTGVPTCFDATDDVVQFPVQGGPIQTEKGETIGLYPSGSLDEIYGHSTAQPFSLQTDQYSITGVYASFFEDGSLRSMNGEGRVVVQGATVQFSRGDSGGDSGTTIVFYPNHAVKSIVNVQGSVTLSPQGEPIAFCDGLTFHDDQSLASGDLCAPGWFGDKDVQFQIQGKTVEFAKVGSDGKPLNVSFHQGGKLESAVLDQEAQFVDYTGKSFDIPSGQEVFFDAKGQIATWTARDTACDQGDPSCVGRSFTCSVTDSSGANYKVDVAPGSSMVSQNGKVIMDFTNNTQDDAYPVFPEQVDADSCDTLPCSGPQLDLTIHLDMKVTGVYPMDGEITTPTSGNEIQVKGSCSAK